MLSIGFIYDSEYFHLVFNYIIKHSDFINPQAILRARQSTQALDTAFT